MSDEKVWLEETFGPSFNDLIRNGSTAKQAKELSRWAYTFDADYQYSVIYFKEDRDYALAVVKYGV